MEARHQPTKKHWGAAGTGWRLGKELPLEYRPVARRRHSHVENIALPNALYSYRRWIEAGLPIALSQCALKLGDSQRMWKRARSGVSKRKRFIETGFPKSVTREVRVGSVLVNFERKVRITYSKVDR